MELESKDLKIEQLNSQLKNQASVSTNIVDEANLALSGTNVISCVPHNLLLQEHHFHSL